ncbi:flagellar assembly protein FliH [Blastococcus sp. DSM 46786]|uniref:FliH/SctL family protein n=1 Tax=Blastococcus sp. DSM 46786 TaxID=1798227 RepID=UPI0008C70593|nr:FliH/SctL family protein [Blastococcus sp. DSM 46786]SEL18097.1 flagellar assembly protein FliH [Blastococcus sp. DSM 46786]
MTSSRDDGHRPPREGAVLRGGSAALARPYREVMAEHGAGVATLPAARTGGVRLPAAPATAAVAPSPAVPVQPSPVERRTTVRRAEDQPVAGSKPSFRLGDVYAEELARLRAQARTEGFAAGHAEGLLAAESVVAEAEREAQERLAEVQARWERRLVSATAALGAAVRQLEESARPVADDIRDSIVGTALTLVEDLLGRELALATDPVMDAVRRALTFCPADAPAVVRLHPDDLAEVPEEALADLPDSVRVVGDPSVERAGAVAESGPRRIDAQLGTALQRVQAVLGA